MFRYKIYLGLNNLTDNKEYKVDDIIEDIRCVFDYASIYQAKGLYKNQVETTLIFEILSDDFSENGICNICKYLKNAYKQECVIYTKDIAKMEVI